MQLELNNFVEHLPRGISGNFLFRHKAQLDAVFLEAKFQILERYSCYR